MVEAQQAEEINPRPPNYDDLDRPPSYAVLFPNWKPQIPDLENNDSPNLNDVARRTNLVREESLEISIAREGSETLAIVDDGELSDVGINLPSSCVDCSRLECVPEASSDGDCSLSAVALEETQQ